MKKFLLYFSVLLITNVLSAQAIFEEDFENGFGDWTMLDRDGDGNGWDIGAGNPAGPVGVTVVSSASYDNALGALTPDNVLTSPEIDLTDQTGTVLIDWQVYAQDQTWSAEHYKVVLSEKTGSDAVDNGTIIYEGEVGSSPSGYTTLTRDMSAFNGKTVFVSFVHYNVTDQFRMNLDGISVYTSNDKDVAVTALKSPDNANGCSLTAEENVSVTLTNLGGQTIQDFEVSYSINGGATVTEMVTEPISPAATYDFTFAAMEDLSVSGNYEIEITTNLDGDTNADNNNGVFDFVSSDAVLTIHMMTDASSAQQWELEDNATGEVVASNYDGYQWNVEVREDYCIFSDKCYTFRYVGEMTDAGTYLELLIDGVRVAGDMDGTGVPASIEIPALGGNCPENDAAMGGILTNIYSPVNVANSISFNVRNRGANVISSFIANYTVAGNAPVEETFTQSLDLGGEANVTFATPATLTALTSETIEVTITKVNGEDDPVTTNNSGTRPMIALSEVPFKSVLVEEGTGTWCPWCPRGDVGVKSVTAAHPDDVIAIAVHNGQTGAPDPMDIGDYDSDLIAQVNGGGYPFSGINRTFETDPSAADLELAYLLTKSINAPVGMEVEATLDAGGVINVDITATNYAAVLDGDYRLSVVLTEDGLSGTTDDWAQANNYAGGTFGPMGGYENLPNPVPASQMVYDHVAREIIGGFDGMANSVPASMAANETHSFRMTTSLNPDFNIANMHAVAMFIDASNGNVLNAASTSIENASSTKDVFVHDVARVFPNPFSSRTNIELSLEGSQDVSMMVLNSLGQRVAQRNYGTLSGKTILPFDGGNLQNGFYYFHIQVDDKLITKRVMLNK